MSALDRAEFAEFVRDNPYRRYARAQLGTARARMKLMINEIDSIILALEQGAIHPDRALGDLAQLGGLAFLQPVEPPLEGDCNVEQQNGF